MNKNILSKIFVYLSLLIFSIITLIFLINNNILLALLMFSIILYIALKCNIKKFPLLLFITSLIIRIIVILVANFPQANDFGILLEASKFFSLDNYTFNTWTHFSTWAYQTAFVIYQGTILKIINSELVLKLLNAVYSSLLVIFIYYVCKKFTKEKIAKMVSLLYMIFPFPLFLNTVLANHHLATILMYVGILFLIKEEKKIKDYVIAAIFISIGNLIRPEGIIVVFSLLVFEIIRLNKNKIFDTIKKFTVFVFIYYLINFGASFLVKSFDINPLGLKNTDPLWKFVLGFNYDTCGYYNQDDDANYLGNTEKEIQVIKQRVLSKNTPKLLVCKVKRFWLLSDLNLENGGYSDKEFDLGLFKIKYNSIESIAITLNSCLYLVTLLMCFIGIIFNREKIMKSNSMFFVILMTVTFFVFLLIEIQQRYAYFIHISIFVISAYGYEYVIDILKRKYKKLKE